MSEKEPTNADVITALQGMWGQQKDMINGVEKRLGAKMDAFEKKIDVKLDAVARDLRGEMRDLRGEMKETERRLGDRITQEIHDRPVVVHVDMGRVSELEKEVAKLKKRLDDLEAQRH